MKKAATVFGVLVVGVTVSPSYALRCGGKTVSIGERKIEVVAKCGEPSWQEGRSEEVTERVYREGERRDLIDEHRSLSAVDEWVYNFGPTRFLYFLRFHNGVLTHIDTGGYGYTEEKSPEPRVQCWSESMAQGRRKVEVLRYCGEPASVDVYQEERARKHVDPKRKRSVERRLTVTVEEWTYNFGPHRLLYVFRFENGRVVGVETRGYGF
jgi:hypothetical protein